MKKEIIILGDVELGGGTLTDDFISDKTLAKFLLELSGRKHPVDLIFNGDSFDFLKCPYIHDGRKHYPRHISSEVSLTKLSQIYKAHTKVFEALRQFIDSKNNRLFFIIGNHDHDLFFKQVQQGLRKLLGKKRRIYFTMKYNQHGVYTEHGHQFDFLNRINPKNPFMMYKGEKILNIPWVAFGIISRFMTLKEVHPFMERIKPIPVLFSHHRAIVKKLSLRSIKYFLLSIFYYPIRHYRDPTYFLPRELFRELYRRLKDVHWDIDQIVEKFKRRKKRIVQKNTVHVLGHVHTRYVEEKDGKVIMHPGSWRDEYILDKKTKTLTSIPKRYVQVLADDDFFRWELKEIKVERSILHLDEVRKNELAFIAKAADEEGYKRPQWEKTE